MGLLADAVEGALNKVSPTYKIKRVRRVSYEDLLGFAITCGAQIPAATSSLIVCQYLASKHTYKITQTLLDCSGHVLNSDDENLYGRVIYADGLDDQIVQHVGEKDVARFAIPLGGGR